MPFIAPIIAFATAAIAGVGSFVAGLGIVGSLAIGAGLSVAIGYISQALMQKPDDNSATISTLPGGVKFERQYGENVPRQVACGLIAISGHDVYVNTYSTSNKILQQVYVLSDYYSDGLSRVAIGGVWQTLGDVADPVKGYPITSGEFANLIWIKFLDGRQTAADAGLVAAANPAGRWGEDNIGVGMTAIIATMDYDQDRNNSFPDFFFEFRGAPLYDWRKDSSVGGSGDHRWNDKTTHEFSENPIVMEYNYRRGFSINDDLFCGMDMPTSDLPLDKYTLAANICDELAEGETRYRCSIFLDCMITHGDNLASIALSCGALQIDGVDGSWPVVGSDLPTVATFTDDDIVSGSNFKFRAKRSMSDLVNSISGNFPDPDQNWSMIGYDTQIASDLVTLDRRTRDINIDFPQVRSQRQACQLAWIYLYENRFEATSSLTLRPAFQRLEAGDWVLWNSARYGALVFIVTNIQLLSLDNEDGPRNVVLELQQRDGSIYDEVEPPPIVVPYPPGEPVYASELDSFTATAVSVVGFEGRAQAAIRVSWAAVLDATITGVEIQYYPVATPEAVIKKVVDPSVTVHTLAEGIISNTLYKVQAKIITTPLRVTNYNAGIELITLNITIGIGQIDGAIFTTLGKIEGELRDQLEMMNTRLNKMAMNNIARTWVDRKVVRDDLVSQTGEAFAQISEVREVATNTESAFASFQTTVTAQFAAQSASIAIVAAVAADVEGWATASYAIKLDVNGYWSGMQLYNGGPELSGVVFRTDLFKVALPGVGGSDVDVFTVGDVEGVPKVGIRGDMVIDGSVTARMITVIKLDAISADIGDIRAGTLADPLEEIMLIDLNNGRILGYGP